MTIFKKNSSVQIKIKDEVDLDCYYCGEVPEKHFIKDDKIFCTKKKGSDEYQAWQDVIDDEEVYSDVVLGNNTKDAYLFKLLPKNVPYFVHYKGRVYAIWKKGDNMTGSNCINPLSDEVKKKIIGDNNKN